MPYPAIPALAKDKANAAKIEKAIKAVSLWKTCESCVHHILVSTVLDITLCKIYNKKTVAEMWATVHSEYEDRTALAQSNMQVAIQAMGCKGNGNLHAHLDLMCKQKDDLAVMIDVISPRYQGWLQGWAVLG
jgi:hypothetical protein